MWVTCCNSGLRLTTSRAGSRLAQRLAGSGFTRRVRSVPTGGECSNGHTGRGREQIPVLSRLRLAVEYARCEAGAPC